MENFVSQPKLSSWGVEEVEANVCEDTFENRQKLTFAKVPFKILEPGLIEVLFEDYGELNKHHTNMFEKFKIILEDPRDPWSDFLSPLDLPLDYLEAAPAWLIRHLNKYNDAVADGEKEHRLPVLPARCKRKRADGSRCWRWSWPAAQAEGFCRGHCSNAAFNAADQMAKMNDAAKMRLSQLTGPSLEALEDLIINSTVPHVRLKAATEVLDRVGIRGGSELTISGQVDHTIKDPALEVRERLQALAERISPPELEAPDSELEPETIEGVIVEEAEVVPND